MRKIIDGKVYDTTTATEICDISPSGYSQNDFNHEDTRLYRSPKGAYFVAGNGGARSRWAHPVGQNGSTDGDGLVLIDETEARSLTEQHAPAATYSQFFGEPEEG